MLVLKHNILWYSSKNSVPENNDVTCHVMFALQLHWLWFSLTLSGYTEHEIMSKLCLKCSNKALNVYSFIFDRLTPELMSTRENKKFKTKLCTRFLILECNLNFLVGSKVTPWFKSWLNKIKYSDKGKVQCYYVKEKMQD